MSGRGLAAGTITALGASGVEFYHLLRIGFDAELLYTTAPYDITVGADTYLSTALVVDIPTITETLKIKPSTTRLRLGGASAAMHALTLTEEYKNTVVTLYLYETSTASTTQISKGFIDSFATSEGEKRSSVDWVIANHWANWDAIDGRFITHANQLILFPGDLGLEFSGITDLYTPHWGNTSYINANWSYPTFVGTKAEYFIDRLQAPYTSQIIEQKGRTFAERLPFVYGQYTLEGTPVFRGVTGFGSNNMWVVYAIAEGECEALIDVTFDGISYTDPSISDYVNVSFLSGSDTQAADAGLVAAHAFWTTAHQLKGICCAVIEYIYNEDIWAGGGVPKFEIQGRKLYDPRVGGANTYSTNPALVLYDYCLNAKGLTAAELDLINEGSTYCETAQVESDADASTIPLFDFNGVLLTSTSVKSNVEKILFTMRAYLPWINGKYTLVIKRHDDTGTYVIDDTNLSKKDTFVVEEAGIKSLANSMSYDFIDGEIGFVKSQVVSESATYLAADNNRILRKTIKNEYEINRFRAENRVATELKETRQQITVDCILSDSDALQLQVGDIVLLTRTTQGWTQKEFRIEELIIPKTLRIKLKLREFEPTVYDWNTPVYAIPPSNTGLPDPNFVAPISNLVLTSGTNELYLNSDGTVISRIKATWTAPSTDSYATGYDVFVKKPTDAEKRHVSRIHNIDTVEYYFEPAEDGKLYTVYIQAINSLGKKSAIVSDTETVIGKTEPPEDVTGFSAVLVDGKAYFSWSDVSDADIGQYEIREGTVWSTAAFVGWSKSSDHTSSVTEIGALDYLIKAVDTSGNLSANATSTQLVTTAMTTPAVTLTLDGQNVIVTFTESTGSYNLDYYEIRQGASWAAGVTIAEIKSNSFSVVVDFLSDSFFVKAYDIAGNASSEGGNTATITPPSVSGLTSDVIDNNVLLRWSHSLGSLPIAAYEIRRGAVFSSADVLQEINGTFAAFFENVSDTYTYWVVGIDTAGNYGTEQSKAAIVNQPPDYVLNVNWLSAFDDTLVNCIVDTDGGLIFPINTTDTWSTHFSGNSWLTPQDQIDAGYPYYIEPSETTGSYVEEFDYGSVLAGTLIKIVLDTTIIDGAATITPKIEAKELIGDAYTVIASAYQGFATSFRYVRVTLTFASAGGDDISKINTLNVVLDSKIKNDMGNGTVSAPASGGEAVVWSDGVTFVDIQSIVVTPNTGTTATHAVVDFTDVPSPTGFTVYLFDSAGVYTTGDFMWSARGY